MRLIWAKFDGTLELEGEIDFPENKVTVLYGANQQGKTNIINAIRYAFLKEELGRKRSRVKYDDWAIPTSQEMVPEEGTAKIIVVFEHNGLYYKLQREISASRKDVAAVHTLSGWPGKEEESIDLYPFIKENLKVGLLDALFAPEIAGGFKRLYGKDIDESIGEVFKEVTSARRFSKAFISRLEKMKIGAEAELLRITSEYNRYLEELQEVCKELIKFAEFTNLQVYEPGKTFEKIMTLMKAIRSRVERLKEDELFRYVKSMMEKARNLPHLRTELSECEEIVSTLKGTRENESDTQMLHNYLAKLREVTTLEDEIEEPPAFCDKDLNKKVKRVYGKLTEAKALHREAKSGADKLGIRLETIKDVIKEVKAIVKILKTRQKIGEEKPATITKIGKKAYTVVPTQILVQDPTFTSLSKQPLPKGPEDERKQYLEKLDKRLDQLVSTSKHEESSARKFNWFLKKDLKRLSKAEEQLIEEIKEMWIKIEQWRNDVVRGLSAFLGVEFKGVEKIESEKDVTDLSSLVAQRANEKEQKYLQSLNERVHPLRLIAKAFTENEIARILNELEKERLRIPAYEAVAGLLDAKKENWRKNDEDYIDYSAIPSMTDQAINVFNIILENSIDEQRLKEAIIDTFNKIINKMRERRLIEAVPEISAGTIRAQVKYKNKGITHPAGSEKAFFTLAILTALGHYFQMPILIDEVANNLDQRNLPAFFNLALELKSEKGIQYLLSIKETKDFDLEGWVKDISNEIAIYELEGKKVQRKMLD